MSRNGLATTTPAAMVTLDSPEGRWKMAYRLLESGFLPKAIKTPAQAFAIVQTGYELRLGPMQSLRSIHVVDGKPGLAAELMLALCYRDIPGFCFEPLEETAKIARGRARRNAADAWFELTVTWDEMAAVQVSSWKNGTRSTSSLVDKENWKNYPRAMLSARMIAAICRVKGPDATAGMHTPDELGAVTVLRDDGSEDVEPEGTQDVPDGDGMEAGPVDPPPPEEPPLTTDAVMADVRDRSIREILDCTTPEILEAWNLDPDHGGHARKVLATRPAFLQMVKVAIDGKRKALAEEATAPREAMRGND